VGGTPEGGGKLLAAFHGRHCRFTAKLRPANGRGLNTEGTKDLLLKRRDAEGAVITQKIMMGDGSQGSLAPNARTAFVIFVDLCALRG
jgi:hypothetical protein